MAKEDDWALRHEKDRHLYAAWLSVCRHSFAVEKLSSDLHREAGEGRLLQSALSGHMRWHCVA